MKLTVVGATGSMSGPTSAASSYLLQAEGADPKTGEQRVWSIVIDMGPGAFGALLHYVEPRAVDAVLISHGHADHIADIISYEVFLKWHPDGANGDFPLYGPEDTALRVAQIDGYDEEGSTARTFDHHVLKDRMVFEIGPMTIEAFAGRHPVEAYGFRVTGPSSAGEQSAVFAYTGDTDSCAAMVIMAKDADVLVSEAGFTEDVLTRGVHMTGKRAGRLAREAAAKELILTHIQPWTDPQVTYDEARSEYSGALFIAQPGLTRNF